MYSKLRKNPNYKTPWSSSSEFVWTCVSMLVELDGTI